MRRLTPPCSAAHLLRLPPRALAQPAPTPPVAPPRPQPGPGRADDPGQAAGHRAAPGPGQEGPRSGTSTPATGPGHDVPIDTPHGTWMSLDVSPDGREIAFDLLGDLYIMPIGGGEARALTTGIAWDMQPRYSPNGSEIAFTSDRGGGDNIWVMNRDGSDPRQSPRKTSACSTRPTGRPTAITSSPASTSPRRARSARARCGSTTAAAAAAACR